MKKFTPNFNPGDLVVNAGICAGLGWVWKVIGYEDQHYNDGYVNKNLVRLRIIRHLNKTEDKFSDWQIGTDMLGYQNEFQLLSNPIQPGLFL